MVGPRDQGKGTPHDLVGGRNVQSESEILQAPVQPSVLTPLEIRARRDAIVELTYMNSHPGNYMREMARLLSSDFKLIDYNSGGIVKGIPAMQKYNEATQAKMANSEIRIIDIVVDPRYNKVRASWVKSGNYIDSTTGEITKTKLEFEGASVYGFGDDGKITETVITWDVTTCLKQLGRLPPDVGNDRKVSAQHSSALLKSATSEKAETKTATNSDGIQITIKSEFGNSDSTKVVKPAEGTEKEKDTKDAEASKRLSSAFSNAPAKSNTSIAQDSAIAQLRINRTRMYLNMIGEYNTQALRDLANQCLHSDVHLIDFNWSDKLDGVEKLILHIKRIQSSVKNITIEIVTVRMDHHGNVRCKWILRGTYAGNRSNAHGKSLNVKGATCTSFRRGKISDMIMNYDSFGVLKQIGAVSDGQKKFTLQLQGAQALMAFAGMQNASDSNNDNNGKQSMEGTSKATAGKSKGKKRSGNTQDNDGNTSTSSSKRQKM